MSNDCPVCAAGNKPVNTLYIDFARIRHDKLYLWVEAARKADKIVFLNVEMSQGDADKFMAAVHRGMT